MRITPNLGQRQKKLPCDVSRVEDIVEVRVLFHDSLLRVGVDGVGKRVTSNLGFPSCN